MEGPHVDADERRTPLRLEHRLHDLAERREVEDDEEGQEEQEDDGRDDDIVHGENDRAEEKARLRVGPREHEGLVSPFDACSTPRKHIADGERHHGEREVGSGEDGLRSAHAA